MFRELQWQTFPESAQYQLAPVYIAELLHSHVPIRSPRSGSAGLLDLVVLRTWTIGGTEVFGKALPTSGTLFQLVGLADSLRSVKARLKIHSFFNTCR